MKQDYLNTLPLSSSLKKNILVFVKFAVIFLLFGFAFRFLVSNSIPYSYFIQYSIAPPLYNDSEPPESPFPLLSSLLNHSQPPISVDFRENQAVTSQNVQCDLFTGDWVPDPSGPVYTNDSCRLIEDHQNCMRNGRPDSDYLYWRWTPRDCGLPKFNPEKFLDLMRHKSWGFIGDSISRNHVQSLLCILSQVEEAVEMYHDSEYRSKIWNFPSYNFTISVIWSPFLVKAETFEDINGVSTADVQLHLDKLDTKWSDQFKNFDYSVIAGGKWFLKPSIYHENNTITGCHHCTAQNITTESRYDYAYRKALQLVLNFIITSSDRKAYVFFRTTTPDHFENGEWFSGGTCNRTTPFRDVEMKDVDVVMRGIELDEFDKAVGIGGGENSVVLKLLDTTRLSLLRPDGHPGPYRKFQPFAKDGNGTSEVQRDCLHWCLPGPIDSWNDLVMEIMVNGDMYR